ncbi:hypothetical protein GT347_12325 [Xylophilus rhododendri]|uniref:Uncharacterized protein n=1 Tax=Xylophilus rhododendri TaxID=2697032 RepID=A0A857J7G1_9BURK|nr:hypothetical protein GT347_12325 [Xylophilus rhododendri]
MPNHGRDLPPGGGETIRIDPQAATLQIGERRQDASASAADFQATVFAGKHQDMALHMARMVQIRGPGNTDSLGDYLDPLTGAQYHVKLVEAPGKARNEVMMGELARIFGLHVPQTQVVVHQGRNCVASALIEGLRTAGQLFPDCAIDIDQLLRIPEECPEIGLAYVVAVLLNVRDIIGPVCDNLGFLVLPDGRLQPYFLNFGGSGGYRARRGRKEFNEKAEEFFSLANPLLAAGPKGMIFGRTPRAMLHESLRRIQAVPDADIQAVIARHIEDPAAARQLFELLIRRRDAIAGYLERDLPTHFQSIVDNTAEFGIDCAFIGLATERLPVAELRKALEDDLRQAIGPALADYKERNFRLLATFEGQWRYGDGVEAMAQALLAEPARRYAEALEAQAASSCASAGP